MKILNLMENNVNTIKESNIVIYETLDGKTNVDVYFVDNNFWMSMQQIEKLFDSSHSNIAEHIKNIYKENEIDSILTCRNFRQVKIEGKRKVERKIKYYSLELVIAVGYRVKSKRRLHSCLRTWLRTHSQDAPTLHRSRTSEIHRLSFHAKSQHEATRYQ